MIRVETQVKQRKTHVAVVCSVSTGAKSGVSREIIVANEAELKEVQDYFNRTLADQLIKNLHDFADGRLP